MYFYSQVVRYFSFYRRLTATFIKFQPILDITKLRGGSPQKGGYTNGRKSSEVWCEEAGGLALLCRQQGRCLTRKDEPGWPKKGPRQDRESVQGRRQEAERVSLLHRQEGRRLTRKDGTWPRQEEKVIFFFSFFLFFFNNFQ